MLFETEGFRFYREVSIGEKDRCFKVSKKNDELTEFEFYFNDDGKRERDVVKVTSSKQSDILENKIVGIREFIKGIL